MAKKRSQRRQPRQGRRGARPQSTGIGKFLPFALVGGVGIAIVAALFFVTADGGGGSDHPLGYEPPTLGAADAPVEFVIWSDFQCPFCKRFETETFPALADRFVDSGEVKFVWRNFQRYGSESNDSGVSSYCAGEQGQFWEFKEIVFENQRGIQTGALSRANLRQWATDLNLDMTAYDTCVSENASEYLQIMAADFSMARDEGVTGTPAFFINGTLVAGAQPTRTFEAYISNALNEARQQ